MQGQENQPMAENYEKVNCLWLYQSSSDSNEWLPYSSDVSIKLTEKYKHNETSFIYIIKKYNLVYEFDFKEMVERLYNHKKTPDRLIKTTSIKQPCPDATSSVPAIADQPSTDGPYKMEEGQYENIRNAFYESVDSSKYKIIKIERIINENLRDQYKCIEEEIRDRNHDISPIERTLWHGMSVRRTNLGLQPVISINTKGFNRSYSELSPGAAYGDGVYFTVKANTSLKYAIPDESGRSYVYFCEVLTGSFTNGRPGLKTAPFKDSSAFDIYDSVVDNVSSPSMFVIFRDNQAYPAYLITFQEIVQTYPKLNARNLNFQSTQTEPTPTLFQHGT